MGLTVELHSVAAIMLFIGHLVVALSYLGIAWVLQLFIASIWESAKLVGRMFSLFSYFIAACGIQHLFAALLFIHPLWVIYIMSVWITGILAMFTFIFVWRLRPQFPLPPKTPTVVVVPS